MNGLLKSILIVALAVFSFSSCKKKAFDDYYSRPSTLASPIYQQLQAKGNFKSLLACIDKAGYKEILSAAGYWTFFAANDSAFKQFFIEKGISDVSQIDSATAKQIVTYSMVYNAFLKSRLSDYQSTTGWVLNQAFRRRTVNYTGFYDDTTLGGVKVKAIGANRNGNFIVGDNNNKYIPYFLDKYMAANAISAYDYNYFYPNTTYTGFNVANARVVTADITAENGYINEVDKVILPLKSIDQYLASKPNYSEFKKLFDKYMVTFVQNSDATKRYNNITGLNDLVYVKSYNSSLGFSPNNENYLKVQDNDGQSNSWTLFVPTNEAFLKYRDSVLLEHYTSLDVVPQSIITDFLNAHMFANVVWPSKFASTTNVQSEPARFDAKKDVVDKQVLSNGNFYGTSKVQAANVFSTVYGKPYLDPKYLLMTRALDQSLKLNITIPSSKFTVFMMSDELLRAKGFDYNFAQSAWQYKAPGSSSVTVGNAARDRLQRILASHIVRTPNDEMANLSGEGIIKTINGEYIKWSGGKLASAGTYTYRVTAGDSKTAVNGRVYYSDSLLEYSDTLIGLTIKRLGNAPGSEFNYFYQLLSNSTLYTAATGDIRGVNLGSFYTVFVPKNDAIQAAADSGYLPAADDGSPLFVTTDPLQQKLIADFIKFHILDKNTVIPDAYDLINTPKGDFRGLNTLYKDASSIPGTLGLNTSAQGVMRLRDNGVTPHYANLIISKSNNLANRCVIHLIDTYLQPY